MDKSELSTSANIPISRREEMGNELGARQVPQYLKYLGLLIVVGRGKKAFFQSVVDRVINKLKG